MQNGNTTDERPYWQSKRLDQMTHAEWEQLCDGCGRCCMLKLEDEDTGDIYLTRLSCKLLDIGRCSCTDYANRHQRVPDCLSLNPKMVGELGWLPDTCAYRLVHEGRDLAWWHPLVSGRPETVHEAGVSVRDWAMPETAARAEELHKYLVIDDD
ncbi:MAG: YcgN family cysteine cluster protein [Alphaproteobacteria bacterium]|nr:YcgN family cysteine cluster protein [Alphaproteobacteria bacterium]